MNGQANDQQQNIFGDQSQAGSQRSEAATQSQPAAKTSTEGELGSGGSNAGGAQVAAPPKQVPGQQAAAADATAYSKNKMGVPNFVTKAQQDIGSAEENLQNEANDYAKNSTKNYAVGNDVYDKAVSGDTGAMTSVRGLFDQTATPVEKFAPKGNYQVDDIGQLSTDKGLDSLLRREGGSQYNAGEAAFDRTLLGRTPEFSQIRASLKSRQDALGKKVDELKTSKTDEAQKANDAALASAQEAGKGYVGGLGTSLKAQNQSDVDAENAIRKQLRDQGKDQAYIDSHAAQILADYKDQYKDDQRGHGLSQYAGQGVNSGDFYHVADDVGLGSAVDENEAMRFKNIDALLGRGDYSDLYQAGSGFGDRQSFSGDDFGKAVDTGAKSANDYADNHALEMRDWVDKNATKKASAAERKRQIDIQKIQDDLHKQYGDTWDNYKSEWDDPSRGLDTHNFFKDYVPTDFYDQGSKDSLAGIAQELGLNPALEKQATGGAAPDLYKSNMDKYRAALASSLEATRFAHAPKGDSHPTGNGIVTPPPSVDPTGNAAVDNIINTINSNRPDAPGGGQPWKVPASLGPGGFRYK